MEHGRERQRLGCDQCRNEPPEASPRHVVQALLCDPRKAIYTFSKQPLTSGDQIERV